MNNLLSYLSKVRNLSENTLRSYQTDLLAFEQWCSREGVAVTRVDYRSLRLYLAYLKQAQYSAKTLNRHLSALRGFLQMDAARKTDCHRPSSFTETILERHEIFHIL